LIHLVREQGRNLLIFQGCICTMILLIALDIMEFLGMGYVQIGIYRFRVLGAFFHVMILFSIILLAYFDWRKGVLLIQGTFFITNLTFSYISMQMGFAFYGYGYFLSCATTFVFSAILAERYMKNLPYHTFVKPNPSKWREVN